MSGVVVKRVVVLGSTGSIGTSTLDLIERLNRGAGGSGPAPGGAPAFEIVGLAAHRSVGALAEQARRFRPRVVSIGSEGAAAGLRAEIGGSTTRVVSGPEGLREVATLPEADLVLAGIVGAAGLGPTHAALRAGKTVALANKEALVMAGDTMLAAARAGAAELLPVDSEHNALHQCLRGERVEEVRRLVLTASGGPFFGRPEVDLDSVTPEQALAHPTWEMGPKISVDSATLMNKALEIIEAHWLFGLPVESIEVVVHPQSAVHSLVEFVDGSYVCQLGATDMRHPIQYALTWPRRLETPLAPLDLTSLKALTFHAPDLARFPCLELGWRALRAGGTMPAVLNAANEVAVSAFLDRTVRFTDIWRINAETIEAHRVTEASSLDVILKADAWAREAANEAVSARARAPRGSKGTAS